MVNKKLIPTEVLICNCKAKKMVGAAIVAALVALACQESNLSRSKAKQLINDAQRDTLSVVMVVEGPLDVPCNLLMERLTQGPAFQPNHESLVFWPGLVDAGIATLQDTPRECRLELTTKGESLRPSKSAHTSGFGYRLAEEVRTFPWAVVGVAEVTGIVFDGDPPAKAAAEGIASFRELMPLDTSLMDLGDRKFMALFVRYDDGWRLQGTNFGNHSVRVKSQKQKAESSGGSDSLSRLAPGGPPTAQATQPATASPTSTNVSSCESGAGGTALPVAQDAYVGSAYHKHGAAGDAELSFGGWGDYYYDYMRFEMPQSAAKEVILCLYATTVPPNDPGIEIGIVTERWEPGTLSIDARPAHRMVKRFGRIVPGWNAVDISDIAREWASGSTTNFGITLIPGGNNQTNGAFAAHGAPNAERRPKLVVRR